MLTEMLPILGSVLAISFSGVMAPGPMFAVTVAKSYRSPWAGVKISIGHAIIEVPIILLIYWGFGGFFENNIFQVVLRFIGGAMLLWMAFSMYRSRNNVVEEGKDLRYGAITAGIIMSATNPFFLIWWATVGSMLVMEFTRFGLPGLGIFTATHWVCDLAWLSLVSVIIYRTRHLWGNKLQKWILVLCSLLMAGFGVYFIWNAFKLLVWGTNGV